MSYLNCLKKILISFSHLTVQENKKALSNFIFQHFNDDFDFLIFIANTSALTNPNDGGYYKQVSNSITGTGTGTGTGTDLFDSSGEYGSQRKFPGIVAINRRGILRALTHEWLHHYANFIFE